MLLAVLLPGKQYFIALLDMAWYHASVKIGG
jgi:hypothetical protein